MNENQYLAECDSLYIPARDRSDNEVSLTPLQRIEDFFSWFTPGSVKKELLDLLFVALSSEDADSWDGRDRSDRIFLYRQLVSLVEATHSIFITAK